MVATPRGRRLDTRRGKTHHSVDEGRLPGDGLDRGREERLFPVQVGTFGFMDIAPDGQSFVITTSPYADGQTIRVLTNWHSRLPAGR